MPIDTPTGISEKSGFNEQSVELLLSTAKDEYNNEQNRTSIIDTKANIALPIISTFFLALVQMNDYKSILELPSETFVKFLIPALLFLSYSASLVLCVISVIFLAKVIHMRGYITLSIRDLYDEDFLKNCPTAYAIQIIRLYCESSEYNKEQNDLRAKWYNLGWRLVLFAVSCFVLYSILRNVFMR